MKTRVAYPADLAVPAALVPVGDTNVLMFNLALLLDGRRLDEVETIVNTLLAEIDPDTSIDLRDDLAGKRAERAAVSTDSHYTTAI